MKFKKFFLLFFLSILFLGMAGRGATGRGELKPELRLKLYNQAIAHYEKAKSLYRSGRSEEALRELGRATKVLNNFPEAHEFAQRIYLEQGNLQKAQKEEELFNLFRGPEGASLLKLREKAIEEIELERKLAPPPDLQPIPTFIFSAVFTALLLWGMVFEYRRLTGRSEKGQTKNPILLESFPDEEVGEISPSWFLKLLGMLLPAPFLFSLIVLLGLQNFSEVLPLFLFSWGVVDAVVYLIFFADLSNFRGLRRPGGGMG